MRNTLHFRKKLAFLLLGFTLLLGMQSSWGQTPVPMSSQGGLTYTENFSDIANWTNNFAAGTGANRWKSVAVNATGTIPDGVRTTVSTATFVTATAGGVQRGTAETTPTQTIELLATGATSSTSAVAIELFLDFTGVNAGSISFDWARVNNTAGDRGGSLKVYTSTNGTAYTELASAAVNNIINNAGTPSGSITTVALPASFNGSSTARIRFYYFNGTTTGASGSRPKISIDNLVVTALATATTPTLTAAIGATVDGDFNITFTDDAVWRTAVTAVKYGATTLTPVTDYSFAAGILTLKPTGGNAALHAAGTQTVTVVATGYADATVSQPIAAGVPTANSTATIDAALAPSATRTITCTAKDQYNNVVSGYVFKYDATITNNDGTSAESYTLDGTAQTATINNINVVATTNGSGVATFTALLPAIVDNNDGISIQLQLSNGTTNIGSDFAFYQLPSQTISFGSLSAVTYGDAPFTVSATGGGSGNPVVFTSSNPAIATCSGTNGETVTIIAPGTCSIYANQAGNGGYNAAPQVAQSLTVNTKTLTITGAAANNKVYNGTNAAILTGSLSSVVGADIVTLNLSGTFADVNVAPGIAVTSTSTLGGANASKYTLSQPTGLMADITQAPQTITFGALANKTTIDAPFSLTGSASSGLAVTYVSSNPAVATVSGSTVTIMGAGSTTITASQAGNTNYSAAADVAQGLLVNSVIYSNQFTGVSACPTNGNVPAVSNNASGASLSRSTITCTALANQFNSTTLNNTASVNNSSYIEFSATAAAGYKLNLTSLSFFRQGSGTAPNSLEIRYSTDGFATSTSWGAAPNTPTSGTILTWDFADFSSANAGTVTFRVYPYGTQRADLTAPAAAATGTFRLDDVTIYGDVSLITSTTWNGTTWTYGAPSAPIDAVIEGVYSTTANGAFTAKKITVDSGSLTINSGTNLTVQNELINNLTAADVVIENNANLIQVNNVSNSGNITVNRNSASIMRQDYTLWSSPVSGQQLQAFSPATLATRFYTYNPSTNLYVAETATNNFAIGTGYLIRTPNTHPATPTIWNGTFAGTPNNGNVDLTVANGSYNAIGNPYPSTINADTFITVNGITEALYFWRKTNSPIITTSSYATYTLAGGAGTSSNSGDPLGLVPNGIIQTGQGFIAKSTSTTLSFTNAMRVGNNANQFLRNTDDKSRIWLNLTNTDGLFSQTMVAYMPTATTGIDAAIDGRFFNDSQTALTSIINAEEFAVQGRPAFEATDVVALGFKSELAGNYTIALDHFDGLFTGNQDIYLKDNLMNTTHDLKAGPYAFATTAGVFNSRFEIVYQNSVLNVNLPSFNENSVVVYKNNGVIQINTGSTVMENVKVFDIRGRLLIEKSKVNAAETTIDSSKFASQVLIVQVTSDSQIKVSKKVVN